MVLYEKGSAEEIQNCVKLLLNTIKAEAGSLSVGDQLKIDTDGYLTKDEGKTATGGDEDPKFVVVKVYTMPDLQPGVKVQRIG